MAFGGGDADSGSFGNNSKFKIPEKVKKIYDTWIFSRNISSKNPNWQLVDTLT